MCFERQTGVTVTTNSWVFETIKIMSDPTKFIPDSPNPNQQLSRQSGHLNLVQGDAPRRWVTTAVWASLAGILFVTAVLLGVRQRQLGHEVQQTLSEAKARGLLEMNLMDKALTLIHDEKKERQDAVERLTRDWDNLNRSSRQQAAELYGIKRGFAQDRQEFTRIDQRFTRMQKLTDTQKKQLAHVDRALSLLNDPEAQQVVFGKRGLNQPRGKIFASLNRLMILLASNLPPVPMGKTYELWLIQKGAEPAPAGLFQSASDGTAMHITPLTNYPASVAVSVEDESGAQAPTSTPILMVEMPAQLTQ